MLTSVTFSPKVASDWDPQKAITTTKLNKLYDNTTNLHERLGGDYTSNTKNHTHNGVDSALLEVGANMLRNGSFEGTSDSWTLTNYQGGSSAVQTTGAMHGKYCLAITSTLLANGGGKAESNEYMPVSPGRMYAAVALLKASAANVSSQLEVVWYDSTLAQISSSSRLQTNTPTAQTMFGYPASDAATAPANAAYARVRATGGVPASGSSIGTVYIDGLFFIALEFMQTPVAAGNRYYTPDNNVDTSYSLGPGYAEVKNARIYQSGTYRVRFSFTNLTYYAQIYKNGVAYGTLRTVTGTFTEDLAFTAGDTVQVFVAPYQNASVCGASNFALGVATGSNVPYPPLSLGLGER